MSQNPNDNKATHDDAEIQAQCVFCKLVRNEIPCVKVYEDSETMAFMDIKPNTPGHMLVIPKEHYENIYGVPAETLCRMTLSAQKVAIAAKNALHADGVNILMNNESAAGQLIWHSHIHVIPRRNEDTGPDDSHFAFASKHHTYISGEMEEIAEKIKTEL